MWTKSRRLDKHTFTLLLLGKEWHNKTINEHLKTGYNKLKALSTCLLLYCFSRLGADLSYVVFFFSLSPFTFATGRLSLSITSFVSTKSDMLSH